MLFWYFGGKTPSPLKHNLPLSGLILRWLGWAPREICRSWELMMAIHWTWRLQLEGREWFLPIFCSCVPGPTNRCMLVSLAAARSPTDLNELSKLTAKNWDPTPVPKLQFGVQPHSRVHSCQPRRCNQLHKCQDSKTCRLSSTVDHRSLSKGFKTGSKVLFQLGIPYFSNVPHHKDHAGSPSLRQEQHPTVMATKSKQQFQSTREP